MQMYKKLCTPSTSTLDSNSIMDPKQKPCTSVLLTQFAHKPTSGEVMMQKGGSRIGAIRQESTKYCTYLKIFDWNFTLIFPLRKLFKQELNQHPKLQSINQVLGITDEENVTVSDKCYRASQG